ncbi:hypothetical protein GCM10027562_30140 [Arthrobacter pigmenti]
MRSSSKSPVKADDDDTRRSTATAASAGTDAPAGDHIRAATDAWESLFRAQVSVMRLLQADAAFKDLSMREYDVLFNLSRCPTGWLRLNDLNSRLLMSQPSLSRMVERLQAKGLVDRKQAPEDHRGVLLALTDKGAELQKSIGREHVRSIGRIVGGALSPDELQQLEALTMKLRAGIGG